MNRSKLRERRIPWQWETGNFFSVSYVRSCVIRSMHSSFQIASGLTEIIIGAAIEVHRDKGPGLIESIYEWCLTKEFELRGVTCVSQKTRDY